MFEFIRKWFGQKEDVPSGTGNPDTATALALTTDTSPDGEHSNKPKDAGALTDVDDDYSGGEDFDI